MNFQQWFEENKHELEDLLRGDVEELLFKAWLAGYEAGGDNLANSIRPYFNR